MGAPRRSLDFMELEHEKTKEHPEKTDKKVHFATEPIMYKAEEWNPRYFSVDLEEINDLETTSCLKETPYETQDEVYPCNNMLICEILFLVFVLSLFFVLIWYIVDKILLLEIEYQVSENSLSG